MTETQPTPNRRQRRRGGPKRPSPESRMAILRARINDLEKECALERLRRVSAQRGLVAYLREYPCKSCGVTPVEAGVQIAYDPDADPRVIAEIEAGSIPKRDDDTSPDRGDTWLGAQWKPRGMKDAYRAIARRQGPSRRPTIDEEPGD